MSNETETKETVVGIGGIDMNWEELMKEYKIKEKEIQILEKKAEPLDEELKQKILDKTLKKMEQEQVLKQENNSMKKHKRNYKIAVILCLVLFMIPVRAGATLLMDSRLKNLWNGDHKKVAVMEINQSVKKGNYTMILKQAAGDEKAAYLMFEIIAPTSVKFQGNSWFEEINVDLDGSGGGYYMEEVKDDNPNDNKGAFLLNVNRQKGIMGYPMKIRLKELHQTKKEEPLTKAQWEFETELHYNASSLEYKVNQKVNLKEEGNIYLKKVRISSIAIELTMQRDTKRIQEFLSQYFPVLRKEKENTTSIGVSGFDDDIQIKLKDGTILDKEEIRDGNGSGSGWNVEKSYYFNQIINPEDVESIVCGGVEISLD